MYWKCRFLQKRNLGFILIKCFFDLLMFRHGSIIGGRGWLRPRGIELFQPLFSIRQISALVLLTYPRYQRRACRYYCGTGQYLNVHLSQDFLTLQNNQRRKIEFYHWPVGLINSYSLPTRTLANPFGFLFDLVMVEARRGLQGNIWP